MKSIAIRFGLFALGFIVLLQLSKYSYFNYDATAELLIILFAVAFITIGILVAKVMWATTKPTPSKSISMQELRSTWGISEREYQVLHGMAEGRSNKEIADKLYISESTVKTHVSNILIKLDAKRRTQAIRKAKESKLI